MGFKLSCSAGILPAGNDSPDGLFSTFLSRVHTSAAGEVSPNPQCRCHILAALGRKRGDHGVPGRAGDDWFHAQPECKRSQGGALRRRLTPEGLPEQSPRYIGNLKLGIEEQKCPWRQLSQGPVSPELIPSLLTHSDHDLDTFHPGVLNGLWAQADLGKGESGTLRYWIVVLLCAVEPHAQRCPAQQSRRGLHSFARRARNHDVQLLGILNLES